MAEEEASDADEVAERSVVLAESEESVAEAVESAESVVEEPVALLLPVEEPVEEAVREELELLGTALHQAVFCCCAVLRLGSEGGDGLVILIAGDKKYSMNARLTGGAVVVAGQDGAGVVAETLPVVVIAVFDPLRGGRNASVDDAVEQCIS